MNKCKSKLLKEHKKFRYLNSLYVILQWDIVKLNNIFTNYIIFHQFLFQSMLVSTFISILSFLFNVTILTANITLSTKYYISSTMSVLSLSSIYITTSHLHLHLASTSSLLIYLHLHLPSQPFIFKVQEQEIIRKKLELEATIMKPADAMKFQTITLANAEKFVFIYMITL